MNLPGESSGSYSQNLNHLWACGSVVVFWRAKFVEWLFPALREGVARGVRFVVQRSPRGVRARFLDARTSERVPERRTVDGSPRRR